MRKVTAIVTMILGFAWVLPAQAAETNGSDSVHNIHQVHFLGKRPYQQPVVARTDAEQAWVGATLRVDNTNHQQTLKMHSLGKRAF
jgi:hypothetical protein